MCKKLKFFVHVIQKRWILTSSSFILLAIYNHSKDDNQKNCTMYISTRCRWKDLVSICNSFAGFLASFLARFLSHSLGSLFTCGFAGIFRSLFACILWGLFACRFGTLPTRALWGIWTQSITSKVKMFQQKKTYHAIYEQSSH